MQISKLEVTLSQTMRAKDYDLIQGNIDGKVNHDNEVYKK